MILRLSRCVFPSLYLASNRYFATTKPKKYRSPGTSKLIELDSRYTLLRPQMRVLEIGSYPGGWTQYLVSRTASTDQNPCVVSVDIEPMAKVPGAVFVHGDITDKRILGDLEKALDYQKVCSDAVMPIKNKSWIDYEQIGKLNVAAINMCHKYLNASGNLLMKTYKGLVEEELAHIMKVYFKDVLLVKTTAAMSETQPKDYIERGEREAEIYMLCKGYLLSKSKELRKIQKLDEELDAVKTEEDAKRFDEKIAKEVEKIKTELASKGIKIDENPTEEEMQEEFEKLVDEEEKRSGIGRPSRGLTLEILVEEYKADLEKYKNGTLETTPKKETGPTKFDLERRIEDFIREPPSDSEKKVYEKEGFTKEESKKIREEVKKKQEGGSNNDKRRHKWNRKFKTGGKDEAALYTSPETDQRINRDEDKLSHKSKRATRIHKSHDRPIYEKDKKTEKDVKFWKD